MARNLSKSMKRIVADLCAVLVIAGAVPVQPIADVMRTSVIEAKATEYTSTQTVAFEVLQINDKLAEGAKINSNSGSYFDVWLDGIGKGSYGANPTYTVPEGGVTVVNVRTDPYTLMLKSNLATAPTISGVSGATLTYGYSSGSVSVSATAAAGHTLSYQWYSNDTDSTTGGTAIPNATSATYNIPTGHDAGTEYYYCVVTATLDSDNTKKATATSGVATVTINKATPVANITLAKALNQQIIQSKSVTGGTLFCKVVKDGVVQREWNSGNIDYAPTESGSYEVLYYIAGNENYTDVGSSTTPKSAGHLAVMPARTLDLKARSISFGSDSGFSAVDNEGVSNLTDGNQETKLCVIGPTATSVSGTNYIEVEFYNDNTYFLLNGGYTMTTGNDTTVYPARNPVSWAVYGMEKGKSSYDMIGAVTNNSSLGARDYSISSFNLNGQYSNKAFSKIKVRFTGCADTNTTEQGRFQLSEMFFDGKVMQNPTYSFTVNSAVTYDHNTHIAVSRTGVGGNIHYVYKKDNATTWTKYTDKGAPQFTDAGTYTIGWYSDIDFTNAFLEKGSETNPIVPCIAVFSQKGFLEMPLNTRKKSVVHK